MQQISEKDIKLCIQGNRSAQERFFSNSCGYIHGVAMRYISDFRDKEEVIQDSYVKIFESLQTFDRTKASLKTWMTKITVNTCLNKVRKKKMLTSDIEHVAHISSFNHLGNNAVEKLDVEDLLSIINSLPNPQKQIFNMYEIEGYNHNEIGKLLDIAPATSRSYLSRVKLKLQEKINSLHLIYLLF